jgi:outer membrane protein
LVDNRYKTGDAQPTDVIDAHTTQTRAEQDLNAALYQYQTAVARLEFAVGAPVAAPAAAPDELTAPIPSTTPSPFALPEAPEPSRRGRRSPFAIPTVRPPLGRFDLVPSLDAPPSIQPLNSAPSSSGTTTPRPQGLAVPPYVVQPPGRQP